MGAQVVDRPAGGRDVDEPEQGSGQLLVMGCELHRLLVEGTQGMAGGRRKAVGEFPAETLDLRLELCGRRLKSRRSGFDHPAPTLLRARVKVCGITRIEDAEEAVRHGAWAIGLNHWENSPRRVDSATALAISSEVRRKLEFCGVFVNASLEEIAGAVEDEQ